MFPTIRAAVLLLLLLPFSARAGVTCADVFKALGGRLADHPDCFQSADLTTNNPSTTPLNNSLPGLPAFAFTPILDRAVIAPAPGKGTPVTKAVPGLQLNARIASDPTGQARFLLRLPNEWNGRLVVAGASGTRSEFNGDFAWSDYVVQQGYAYASQNKGVLNLQFTTAADPLGCRLNPASTLYAHFYDNDPGQLFTRWAEFMIKAAELARDGVKAGYGRPPRFTYAVGTSNGGYQVRRAVELAPELFDGGVNWEGTFVDEHAPNILTDLPPAILNFPDYVASGFDPASPAAKNNVAAGYPPDIVVAGTTDALLPIDHHARAHARMVAVASRHKHDDDDGEDRGDRKPAYRLYEIQNGNHIETYQDFFPQLELIMPHAQRAFDLLVN